MIKAVFMDIDGTLFSHKSKSVPDSALLAIRKCQERGIRVFSATGRAYFELAELNLQDIAFDGHVLLSGQLCVDGDGRLIHADPFCQDDLEVLKEILEEKEYSVMVAERDRIYVNCVSDEMIEMQLSISSSVPPIARYEGADVYQISVAGHIAQLKDFLRRFRNLTATYWTDASIDLINSGGGKAKGTQHMIENYGITKDEIIVIGDANNDISMFDYAGISVCMGNGEQQAKDASDYVTADIDDNGVYKALDYYLDFSK